MGSGNILNFLLCSLAVLKLSTCHTIISNHDIKMGNNGEKLIKTWTSSGDGRVVETTDYKADDRSADELLKQLAVEKGMDGSAIDELLKTKQPVVRTTNDGQGTTRTTTYKLEPSGTISSRTVTTAVKPVLVNRGSIPYDELLKNDGHIPGVGHVPINELTQSGVVTRTYTNPDGSTVLTTYRTPDTQTTINTNTRTYDWPEADMFEQRFNTPTAAKTPVHLPETWNPYQWHKKTHTKTITETQPRFINDNERVPINSFTDEPRKWASNVGSWRTETTAKPRAFHESAIPSLLPVHDIKPVQTINIEDLPITEVLNNGKPLDVHNLQTLPEALRPQHTLPNVINIQDIPNTDTDTGNSIVNTNVKTITKTIRTDSKPTAEDLEPEMRKMLERGGINLNDIPAGGNNTLTTRRVEPDGRVVTTTFRQHALPAQTSSSFEPDFNAEKWPSFKPFETRGNFGVNDFENLNTPSVYERKYNYMYQPKVQPRRQYTAPPRNDFHNWFTGTTTTTPKPQPTIRQSSNPIEAFLAQVGLSTTDIESKNGEVIKTIIDKEGRILTATFLLSAIKGDNVQAQKYVNEFQPLK